MKLLGDISTARSKKSDLFTLRSGATWGSSMVWDSYFGEQVFGTPAVSQELLHIGSRYHIPNNSRKESALSRMDIFALFHRFLPFTGREYEASLSFKKNQFLRTIPPVSSFPPTTFQIRPEIRAYTSSIYFNWRQEL